MKNTSLERVVALAEESHSLGKRWHFHILAPTCCFNHEKGQYGLVVEIPQEAVSLVAYVPERPVTEGKKLVTLLHGATVLDGSAYEAVSTSAAIENQVAHQILERAKHYNEQKIPWHHHMLFPDCALNPHTGRWNLLFEDPVSGEMLSALYELEPIADLKRVEALFYNQA